MIIKKEDKWKAVSHLQKCIRRGWADKIPDVARALWSVDNAYLRYRLAVIAVEDVGIANVNTVATLLDDKINKRWVDANGGIEGLINYMQQLANGSKDRTACTWGSIASKQDFEAVYGSWADTTTQKAIEIAHDAKNEPTVRAAAVLRSAGTNLFPHRDFPEIEGDWNMWVESQVQIPELIKAMNQGQKSQKEWHAAFLGLCWTANNNNTSVTETLPKDLGDVHGYCSAAIDGHTAEGQMAIKKLWFAQPLIRDHWQSLGWHKTDAEGIESLKKMVFLLEGGIVNKQLNYPLALQIDAIQKQRWSNIAQIDGKQAAKSVWASMPVLHNLRQTVVMPQPAAEYGAITPEM